MTDIFKGEKENIVLLTTVNFFNIYFLLQTILSVQKMLAYM